MVERAGYQPLPPEIRDELEEMSPEELRSWVGIPKTDDRAEYSDWMYRAHEAHSVMHDQYAAAKELSDEVAAKEFYGVAGNIEEDITFARLAFGIVRYVERNAAHDTVGDNCLS